jgi:DNA-binding NarL/FixJ family response regulator
MTSPRRPRILLADDSAELLRAFDRLLASSCEVVGHVSDAGALVDEARRLEPDVIVIDLFMPPGMDGLKACRELKKIVPHTKTIIVSAENDASIRKEALKAGASAFVEKVRAADDLVAAIRDAMAMSA